MVQLIMITLVRGIQQNKISVATKMSLAPKIIMLERWFKINFWPISCNLNT